MADATSIEWTQGPDGRPGATWNPIRGTRGSWTCVKVSPGCAHCYAERLNRRLGGPPFHAGADQPRLDETILTQPLRWQRPRRIFVASMTDLFGEWVPDEWLDRIFAVIALWA
jgi:protein gp37